MPAPAVGIVDGQRRGLLRQQRFGAAGRGFQLVRRRRHAQLARMILEHAQQHGIAPHKDMPHHPVMQIGMDRGDRRLSPHLGHMAGLAALLRGIGAVLPFLKRHLLGQPAGGIALVVHRVGEKRVAGGAQRRVLDVVAATGNKAGGRMHDPFPPPVGIVERPEQFALFRLFRDVDDEAAVQA